jgi:hypothetical protein
MFVKEVLMERAWLPVQLHPKLNLPKDTYWLAQANSLFYHDVRSIDHLIDFLKFCV